MSAIWMPDTGDESASTPDAAPTNAAALKAIKENLGMLSGPACLYLALHSLAGRQVNEHATALVRRTGVLVLVLPESKDYKNHGDDGQAQMAQRRVRLRQQVMGLVFAGRLKAGDCGEKQHALKNSGAAPQKRDWIHASSFLIPSNIMRHIAGANEVHA
jgi:hypothetical protein